MYIVFGYDDMCKDFSYRFDSFVQAYKAFKYLEESLCVAFMKRTDDANSCLFCV